MLTLIVPCLDTSGIRRWHLAVKKHLRGATLRELDIDLLRILQLCYISGFSSLLSTFPYSGPHASGRFWVCLRPCATTCLFLLSSSPVWRVDKLASVPRSTRAADWSRGWEASRQIRRGAKAGHEWRFLQRGTVPANMRRRWRRSNDQQLLTYALGSFEEPKFSPETCS